MRVFLGTDPLTEKALRHPHDAWQPGGGAGRIGRVAAVANVAPTVEARSSMSDLLERWFAAANASPPTSVPSGGRVPSPDGVQRLLNGTAVLGGQPNVHEDMRRSDCR